MLNFTQSKVLLNVGLNLGYKYGQANGLYFIRHVRLSASVLGNNLIYFGYVSGRSVQAPIENQWTPKMLYSIKLIGL